jgi:hypothetical protein
VYDASRPCPALSGRGRISCGMKSDTQNPV